jgi:hypothetical protein
MANLAGCPNAKNTYHKCNAYCKQKLLQQVGAIAQVAFPSRSTPVLCGAGGGGRGGQAAHRASCMRCAHFPPCCLLSLRAALTPRASDGKAGQSGSGVVHMFQRVRMRRMPHSHRRSVPAAHTGAAHTQTLREGCVRGLLFREAQARRGVVSTGRADVSHPTNAHARVRSPPWVG